MNTNVYTAPSKNDWDKPRHTIAGDRAMTFTESVFEGVLGGVTEGVKEVFYREC